MSKLLLDFEVSSAANSGLLRIESWAAIHAELIWIMVAFLAALLLMLTFFILKNRRYRRKKDREMSDMVRQFIDERNKSEAILTDLDIGVIAYSSDGVKINSNPAAHKMLYPDHEPETLKELLGRYGQDNGLQAGLLLGNKTVTGTVQLGDRILRIRLKESMIDEKRKAGTIVILQDITEQEREEKQRKEFVANVSHELRTPLTSIKSYTETLLDGMVEDTETAYNFLKVIDSEADRMTRIVKDLLQLSRMDNKSLQLNKKWIRVIDLVKECIKKVELKARGKKQDLENYVIGEIPLILADHDRIEQVVLNILSNAINYTPEGGSIVVYVGRIYSDVYIKVADTGIGIPEADLERIFERFYRVDKARSRELGGTGLGLSIVKDIVELHGGHVSIKSAEGQGTEVTVTLPVNNTQGV